MSTYIQADKYMSEVQSAWDNAARQFLKVEVLQAFEEPGDPSYEALRRRDFKEAVRLVRERVAAQEGMYREGIRRGMEIVRLRVVEWPLTEYLRYEIMAYVVAETIGERVLVIERESLRPEVERELREFNMFDQRIAFLLDYTPEGLFRGAWRVEAPSEVARLIAVASALSKKAVQLASWMQSRDLVIDH